MAFGLTFILKRAIKTIKNIVKIKSAKEIAKDIITPDFNSVYDLLDLTNYIDNSKYKTINQVSSSFVAAIGWIPNAEETNENEVMGTLLIEWTPHSSKYGYRDVIYYNVSVHWYEMLIQSPSIGRFIRLGIQPTHKNYNTTNAQNEYSDLIFEYEEWKKEMEEKEKENE